MMKINPWKKELVSQENIGVVYSKSIKTVSNLSPLLQEQFKGHIIKKDKRFAEDIGEEHPFDYTITEGLYRKMGFVKGVIDKYVDFIVGPGFFVKSTDERAKKIIEDFMQDVNFDTLIRSWIKESLIKGNSFIEIGGEEEEVSGLKTLNANFMYVKRDDLGTIKGYTQFIPKSTTTKNEIKNKFEPRQIAHLAIDRVGDDAYGIGIIFSAINILNNILESERDAHTIQRRKANSPYHIKIGSLTTNPPIMPSQATVDNWGAKLQFMNEKTEWVTGPDVEMSIKNFGNLSEKFEGILKHDKEMFFATVQVPQVLLGAGNIPEGLAKVQMDGFERSILSKQAEAEKVIETQIFSRILQSHGIDAHVEMEWGQPSSTENNERINKIGELMKSPFLSIQLRQLLEEELATLFGFPEERLELDEEQRAREEERNQPIVPGQNRDEKLKLGTGSEKILKINRTIPTHEDLILEDKDYTLKEWLGFNYRDYLDAISKYLVTAKFVDLLAKNSIELEAGLFSTVQVNKLKSTLNSSFDRGLSIKQISEEITRKVRPQDLFKIEGGRILRNEVGDPIIKATAANRALSIARTETTRSAVEGALLHFKSGDVERVRFVASIGARTCPICEGLNGQIFNVVQASGMIPVHTYCRCTFIPIQGE